MSHPSFEAAGQPARGFGLIYQADIQAPLNSFQGYAPVNFLFERDGPQDFRVYVDTLTEPFMVAGQTVEWENPSRIALEAGGPVGLLAEPVTDAVRSAMEEATLPGFNLGQINNVPINITAEQGLALFIRQFMGTGAPIPSNFDVMLGPEGTSGNRNVLLFTPEAGSTPIDQNRVRLVFLR